MRLTCLEADLDPFVTTPKMANSDSADIKRDQHGRGLSYCLALFISHEGTYRSVLAEVETLAAEGALQFEDSYRSDVTKQRQVIERIASTRWFTYAAAPLRHLEIPASLPLELQQRLRRLHARCTKWSLPEPLPPELPEAQETLATEQLDPSPVNVSWSLEEAKELVRLIDELHGIPTSKERRQEPAKRAPCLVYRDS